MVNVGNINVITLHDNACLYEIHCYKNVVSGSRYQLEMLQTMGRPFGMKFISTTKHKIEAK